MPDLDVNTLVQTAMGGAVVWTAIRMEIKYLWKSVDRHEKQIEKLIEEKKGR